MGGSEEAVIYLTEELAKRGHFITVYGDPSSLDLRRKYQYGEGFVLWESISAFDINQNVDIFIAWRYAISLLFGNAATKRFLWLHDLIAAETMPPSTRMVMCFFKKLIRLGFNLV